MGTNKKENKRYTCVLFDLDGTLTDPYEGITRAVAYSLAHFVIEVSDRQQLRAFIGPPLRESFPRYYGIPEDRVEEAVAVYREYFSEKGIFENHIYDGIESMLAAVRDRGTRILLATSKPEQFARRITAHFGIDGYFYRQCGASMDGALDTKGKVIEYALRVSGEDRENTLMVGDRLHDVLGARENGIDSAGVLWGYGSREELEQAGADMLFDSVGALGTFLTR